MLARDCNKWLSVLVSKVHLRTAPSCIDFRRRLFKEQEDLAGIVRCLGQSCVTAVPFVCMQARSLIMITLPART